MPDAGEGRRAAGRRRRESAGVDRYDWASADSRRPRAAGLQLLSSVVEV